LAAAPARRAEPPNRGDPVSMATITSATAPCRRRG
jgi:hypothetical protein